MPQVVRLLPSTRFKRDFEEVCGRDRGIMRKIESLKSILQHDPYNRSRQYNVKKLKNIPAGEGQYRVRIGKYRLRYDIIENDVILYSLKHRRDAY